MKRLYPTLLALSAALVPTVASAATWFDLRIPAPACQPRNSTDAAKLKLTNGVWTFATGHSGEARLFCPLHLSRPDAQADSVNIASFRLWYHDPDGDGASSFVRAELLRRGRTSTVDSLVTGGVVDSDDFVDNFFIRTMLFVNHIGSFLLFTYHVEVTLQRDTTATATPAFVGLDFQPSPQ